MDTALSHAGIGHRLGFQEVPRPVLIAIAFYKNERLVTDVVSSLIACARDIVAISARVVLYNDSPDHAPLGEALAAIISDAASAFPCRVETNTVNIGFVRTMNRAVAEAVSSGCDLLMLNSDTRVHPGALREMARVLNTDSTIAFVNPRSNNATIATLPLPARLVNRDEHERIQAYDALAHLLPDISYVPTAVGFCMLIRWAILAEFGGLDEIYGHGYNEENDLVMRVTRCGYRAVLANKAFVWHEGEVSFRCADITRDYWERANRDILDKRYPEYAGYTGAYFDAPETIAETLLAALIPDESGRLDLALDFSSFRADHNGTFQAGRQLLEVADRVWGQKYNTHVICAQDVYDFHGYAALGIPRCDPHTPRRFAGIFRVGQPYDWNSIQRLCMTGAATGIFMLDTISVDCPQLFSPYLYNMWQFTLDHVDVIATQSRHTEDLLARRFRIPAESISVVSMHSLDLSEYRLPVGKDRAIPATIPGQQPRLLVLGNHFHHKYLAPTANALAQAFPERSVVALGQGKPPADHEPDPKAAPVLMDAANLIGLKAGDLDNGRIGACYAAADAVILPSHAEGFGFPLLNALAARRPVFVRNLPVFLELWEHLERNPNIHFFSTTHELIQRLQDIPVWIDVRLAGEKMEGAERSAREICASMDLAISRAHVDRIVRRVRAVQFTSFTLHQAPALAASHGARVEAAHLIASKLEAVLRRAFGVTPIYRAARSAFHAARGFRRLVRR